MDLWFGTRSTKIAMPHPVNVSLCSCTYVFHWGKDLKVKSLFLRVRILKITMGITKKTITIYSMKVHFPIPLPTLG